MYQYKAVLLDIVDGDTITMEISLGFYVTIKQRLRLYGINTAELHAKDPAERDLANKAKQFVAEQIIVGNTYVIDTYKNDKYGRLLAVIHLGDGLTLNQLLIDKALAKEYMK